MLNRLALSAATFLAMFDGPTYADLIPLDERMIGLELGVQLEDGHHRTLAIAAISEDPDSDALLYWLNDSSGQPQCQDDDGNALPALPLNGSWDERGTWQNDGLTFACTDGVLAKCVRWGYAPWQEKDGVSLRAYHQTCTRLARADYCGDGVGHTRNGTRIQIWDRIGIQLRENAPDMTFEAEWRPDGAHNIARTRFLEAMAYVEGHCPERLAGRGAKQHDAPLIWNESQPH